MLLKSIIAKQKSMINCLMGKLLTWNLEYYPTKSSAISRVFVFKENLEVARRYRPWLELFDLVLSWFS